MGKAGEAEGMWEVSFHFLASPGPKRESIASSLIPTPAPLFRATITR